MIEFTIKHKEQYNKALQKWVKNVVDTTTMDQETVKHNLKEYRKMLASFKNDSGEPYYKVDVPTVFVNNPLEAWIALDMYQNNGVSPEKLNEELRLYFEGGNPNGFEPKATFNDKTFIPAILPYVEGNLHARYLVDDEYFLQVMKEENLVTAEELSELEHYVQVYSALGQMGMVYTMFDLNVVTERPTVRQDEEGRLHGDGVPAFEWQGLGNSGAATRGYYLHGVKVPEYLAMEDSHKIDIKKYIELDNADVRSEFIRKVGIERFVDDYGEIVDTYTNYDQEEQPFYWASEYQLIDMGKLFIDPNNESETPYAPYLKMKNQTTHVWHLEGVSPERRTVTDAIKERFGGRDLKIVEGA